MVTFAPATREKAFLRMALQGHSGSGKTYTALNIAKFLANGGKVAVVDTERGSASKYAGGAPFTFDVADLETFEMTAFMDAVKSAEVAGYDVLIIDSLSHAWIGEGGALDLHDKATARRIDKNSFAAWADVTPLYRRMFDAITGAQLHVIVTMRTKTEYIVEQNKWGKQAPRKVGTAPMIRDGSDYEFDVVGELDAEHNLVISKTRCPSLDSQVFALPGENVAEILKAWLETGEASKPPTSQNGDQQDETPDSDSPPTPQTAPEPGTNRDVKISDREDLINEVAKTWYADDVSKAAGRLKDLYDTKFGTGFIITAQMSDEEILEQVNKHIWPPTLTNAMKGEGIVDNVYHATGRLNKMARRGLITADDDFDTVIAAVRAYTAEKQAE